MEMTRESSILILVKFVSFETLVHESPEANSPLSHNDLAVEGVGRGGQEEGVVSGGHNVGVGLGMLEEGKG